MSLRRRILASAVSLLTLAAAASSGPAAAETLLDAVNLAYQTNPDLQQQRASQRALDETFVQARSDYRLNLSVSASGSVRDPSPGFGNDGRSSSATLSVTQPIYSGGRIASGVDAAQADILQGRENLRAVEINVLQSVIQAYVDVRRDIEALRINEENVKVLQRQLQESRARFEVGEITRTDVAQSEARLASSQAQLAQAQAQLAVSRANYASVVGQAPETLAEEPPLPGVPDSFDAAVDVAQDESPTVRSAIYAQQASRARVALARSDRLPSASLSASYGAALSPGGGGLFDRDEARATASISVPVLTGGLVGSRVRQAIERDNAALIGIDGARRDALQAVSQAWARVLSTRASLTSNQEQVRAASIAAEGVRQEAQVGLRTTLDVLNAELELRDAQLSLVYSRRDNYVATAQLLAAMGRLEARDLTPQTPLYDPKANFNTVRDKGGTPLDRAVEALDRIGKPDGRHAAPVSNAPIDVKLRRKDAPRPR